MFPSGVDDAVEIPVEAASPPLVEHRAHKKKHKTEKKSKKKSKRKEEPAELDLLGLQEEAEQVVEPEDGGQSGAPPVAKLNKEKANIRLKCLGKEDKIKMVLIFSSVIIFVRKTFFL